MGHKHGHDVIRALSCRATKMALGVAFRVDQCVSAALTQVAVYGCVRIHHTQH